MTITITHWIFPLILTVLLFFMMVRPTRTSGDFSIEPLLRLFWFVPILGVWLLYFIFLYFTK